MPREASGDILLVDDDGNEITGRGDLPEDELVIGTDGFILGRPVEAGSHDIEALGTPLELTFDLGWATARNDPGDTAFIHTDSDFGDEMVAIYRPHVLADPTNNASIVRAADIATWLDAVEGIEPEAVSQREIGGRAATYFEVEITDRSVCGQNDWCFGFIATSIGPTGIAGWSFEPGFPSRVWWIDQGDEAPLVIIASRPADEPEADEALDALLATLVIGGTQPHPVPFEESGF